MRSFGKLDKILLRLRTLLLQLDEMYYLASENYRMLSALKNGESAAAYVFDDAWSENDPAICHALGEIDGHRFLECKESFEEHYRAGSRVFELDLSLTRDGKPAVLHDWDTFRSFLPDKSYGEGGALSEEEFMNARPLGRYTPLTLERFVKLAGEYSDARFIISVKSLNQGYDETVRTIFRELFRATDAVDPEIRKRYILHAYSFDFLHRTMEEYPFSSCIYRCRRFLHPEVLAKELNRCGVHSITVLEKNYARKYYCRILHDNGIKIIGCAFSPKEIALWRACGADMFMTPLGEKVHEEI